MAVYYASYDEDYHDEPEVASFLPSPFSTQEVGVSLELEKKKQELLEKQRQCLLEDCLGAMYGVNHAFMRACVSHNWTFDIHVVAHVVEQLNTRFGGWYIAHTQRLTYQADGEPNAREYTYIVIRRRPESVNQLDFFFAGR
jgi:hypothetical protein